jgi:hypothetical protein
VRTFAGETATCAIHERTSAGAAGVSPPWIGKGSRLQNEANNVRRTPTAASRAAGVSPPWYGNRAGSTERFLLNEGARMPRGLTPPLLVVLRCGHSPTKLRLVRHTNARFPRAATVSPPPFSEPRLRLPRDDFPRFTLTCGLNPRGANAPRSWRRARRSLAGKITPFAMHKRMCTRAAGVSPPWYGNRTCNGDRFSWSDYVHHARSDGAPRLADANRCRRRSWWTHANGRKCAASLCTGESFHNHGCSRQPLLVHDVGPLKNNDIHGAQTHVSQERRASARRGTQNRPRAVRIERCSATSETTIKTGGREPAVVR